MTTLVLRWLLVSAFGCAAWAFRDSAWGIAIAVNLTCVAGYIDARLTERT